MGREAVEFGPWWWVGLECCSMAVGELKSKVRDVVGSFLCGGGGTQGKCDALVVFSLIEAPPLRVGP